MKWKMMEGNCFLMRTKLKKGSMYMTKQSCKIPKITTTKVIKNAEFYNANEKRKKEIVNGISSV